MSRVRMAGRVLGELILTAGVLVLLFVVWQVVVVGFVDSRSQAEAARELEQRFAQQDPGVDALSSGGGEGGELALLRVPRLGGSSWVRPVYEGVSPAVLAKGLGRYPASGQPGQVGNLAIAGHRAGHGNPLLDIDTIRPGDVLVVETSKGYAVYRARQSLVVAPSRGDVLAPVPERPGATPTEAYLTLTSCEPRYGSRSRYVVHALLDRYVSRAEGLPTGLLAEPAAI